MKNAIIITIGDELLQGFTYDSNASWISKYLTQCEICVARRITLPDCEKSIYDAISYIIDNERIDYIIMTGGLGPTHDDITKHVLKKYFKTEFIIIEEYLQELKHRFNENSMKIPENISSQATILKDSLPIINKNGTALGMRIIKNNVNIVVLPGVPLEMKQMIKNCGLFIEDKGSNLYYTMQTTGIYESKLYNLLSDLIEKNKTFKIAFLPKYSGVNIRISKDNNISDKFFLEFKDQVRSLIKQYIYSESGETIEEVVGKELLKTKLTLSIAESCTGGLISKKITDLSGSSSYFLGSVVAYSNNLKKKLLNVNDKTLKKYGAVSQEVAIEMANGVNLLTNSDISIATTGISGPTGGCKEKHVGLVYIAIKYNNKNIVKKFNLIPKRELHREIASNVALNMLRLLLVK